MANYIFKNNVEILRCSNWAMDLLYSKLLEVIKKHNQVDEEIDSFVEQLNQDIYGRGCIYVDLLDSFHSESSLMKFKGLVTEVITIVSRDNTLDREFIEKLNKFKNAIIN